MTNFERIRFAVTATVGAVLFAGVASPVQAFQGRSSTAAAQATAAQADAVARQERQICVSTELTGSRMVRRICRTAAEWERAGGLPRGD
jgi:hypothetical protein